MKKYSQLREIQQKELWVKAIRESGLSEQEWITFDEWHQAALRGEAARERYNRGDL